MGASRLVLESKIRRKAAKIRPNEFKPGLGLIANRKPAFKKFDSLNDLE